jgi:hypothetical protein
MVFCRARPTTAVSTAEVVMKETKLARPLWLSDPKRITTNESICTRSRRMMGGRRRVRAGTTSNRNRIPVLTTPRATKKVVSTPTTLPDVD